MRPGFSGKELAEVFKVDVRSTTKTSRAFFRLLAELWLLGPDKVFRDFLPILDEVVQERFERIELERLEAMQTGRADRPVPASRPVSARAVRP